MYNIAVVEDNDQDRLTLSSFIQRYSQEKGIKVNVVCFSDTESFLNKYKPSYDIIFMDIEFSGMNGMEASRKLREFDSMVTLVFVTNMTQYAIKGYEVDALDYILKPVEYYHFAMKMTRAIKYAGYNQDQTITISKDGGMERINVLSLYYVEVNGHYLTFHTDSGEVVSRGKISDLEEELKPYHFSRCNSYYLVNLRFVNSVHGLNLKVANNALRMSRTKQKGFLNDLTAFLGGGKR